MTFKRFETFVIICAIGLVGVIYALTKPPLPAAEVENAQTQSDQKNEEIKSVPVTYVKYDGVEGKNALELLQASHQVATKEFPGVGAYVVGIDGNESDTINNFWGFYVNGQQSPIGASQYVSKNGDVIEWKLESINPM